MSALPLGRYKELLDQLLQLNEQTAALRRELGAWTEVDGDSERLQVVPNGDGGSSARTSEIGNGSLKIKPLDAAALKMDQSRESLLPSEDLNGAASSSGTERRFSRDCVDGVNVEPTPCLNNLNFSKCNKIPASNGASSSKKGAYSKNRLNLNQTDLISDVPGYNNLSRRPHFLDDDYHLKTNDCRIPKPHFLDHSPSPDEEKIVVSDIQNINDQIDDISWSRSNDLVSPQGNSEEMRPYVKPRNFKENVCMDDPHFLDRQSYKTNSASVNDILPNQPSSSISKCYLPINDGYIEKDYWHNQDSCSVKSFSSAGSGNAPNMSSSTQSQLGTKVDCVYSLLSLLTISADNNADMSDYLLKMSQTIESCIAMRQSGCIPLLVQLIHSKHSHISREKAAQALHNLIHAQPDDKAGRREIRVLRLLEQVRGYCRILEDVIMKKEQNASFEDDMEKHPTQSVAALMKLSFDEEHRHVMCQLGGLQALAALVTIDQKSHGSLIEDVQCVTMRKYSGMALTNLTFGDGNNKALLCSFKDFMISLVDQLQSPNDDMRQVTAAVLRNLSWRADSASKQILREVGAVKGLTIAAMTGHKEATLKSVLSALWNLTAHCSLNKVEICSVDGALAFLVDMLSFDAPSKTLAIIENAGGILRNVSSHIAVREEYRKILREHNCLKVLLQQLKSPSLTIVSNSCGTLWNLSARCQEDQQFLWDHGAIPMLRSLIHSKHKMISMGSSAALKNLLNSKPGKSHITSLDTTSRDLNMPSLPTLGARKQKALEHEIDQNLAETCENIEPATSPTTNNRDEKLLSSAAERHLAMSLEKRRMTSSSPLIGHLPSQISLNHSSHFGNHFSCIGNSILQAGFHKTHSSKSAKCENVNRSDSKDSVTSTHSDSVYERVSRNNKIPKFCEKVSETVTDKNLGSCNSVHTLTSKVDSNFIRRYSRNGVLNMCNRSNNIPRNNYSDSGYDIEQDCCDQPIDYSQKYSETKASHDTICENVEEGFSFPSTSSASKAKDNITNYPINSLLMNIELNAHNDKISSTVESNVAFGDYQETDLDQPTDYSLRYAEDQSELESSPSEAPVPSIHEDTIKHFCTEGTPYETPINFSTATSMSDLRAIGPVTQMFEKPFGKNKMANEPVTSVPKESSEMSHSDEKDICSLEDTAKHDNDKVLHSSTNNEGDIIQPISSNVLKFDSKFSSGMLSPDKPVNYCEEGTPGYFSRVSSLSSLEEINGDKWESKKGECLNDTFATSASVENFVSEDDKQKQESKSTNLENVNVINYSEETPLMFSRCSSLGSLSECSVPDQPDDVGSVVSEFSRLTSGCISPSELPDSPTQTPPPRLETSNIATTLNKSIKHYKTTQPTSKLHSVFEDEVATFKFEHTPIEFSTQTSLSSLTIDDEPSGKIPLDIFMNTEKRSEGVGSSNPIEILLPRPDNVVSSANSGNSLLGNDQICKNNEQESEEILAACIDAGVQSRIKTRNPNIPEKSSLSIKTKAFDKNGISNTQSDINSEQDSEEILAACIDAGVQSRIKTRKISTTRPQISNSEKSNSGQDCSVQADTCHTYCTEDTPLLSKVGSHSDLSVLSINESDNGIDASPLILNGPEKDDSIKKDYSDDSSNISGENEHILAECIRSGMPKSTLPPYIISQDETENYAVEGSPFQYSLCSSLSDLTVASDKTNTKARLIKSNRNVLKTKSSSKTTSPNKLLAVENFKQSHQSPNGSLSSLSMGSDDDHILDMAIRAGVLRETCPQKLFTNEPKTSEKKEQKKSFDSLSHCTVEDKSEDHVTVLTRNDSLSSLSVDSLGSNEGDQAILEQCIKSGMPKARPNHKWECLDSKTMVNIENIPEYGKNSTDTKKYSKNIAATNSESKSFEDFGKSIKIDSKSSDNDILEKVIYNGLPKSKSRSNDICSSSTVGNSDEYDGHSLNVSSQKNLPECSKNVQTASVVVGSGLNTTRNVNIALSTSDVKHIMPLENISDSINDKSIPKSSQQMRTNPKHSIENPTELSPRSLKDLTLESSFSNMTIRNGSEETSRNTEDLTLNKNLNGSVESSTLCHSLKYDFTMVDSLTEVCSSSEKAEKPSTDTWNENTCPNDVSFPTISGSNPLISSTKSDFIDEMIGTTGLPDLLEESMILSTDINEPDLTNKLNSSEMYNSNVSKIPVQNALPNVEKQCDSGVKVDSDSYTSEDNSRFTSLSNSTIIENEAARLAVMMKRNLDISFSLTESGHSMYSMDLDHVKPPSLMGSLVSLSQSMSGNWDDHFNENPDKNNLMKKSIQNAHRKKSLPHDIVMRKAINHCISNHESLEHTEGNYSNLDHIKPPSEMEDVLDMENSIMSVASIVSEVADSGNASNSRTIFDTKHPVCNDASSYMNIESINPPSLFNDISEMTMENDNSISDNENCITFTLHQDNDFISSQTNMQSNDVKETISEELPTKGTFTRKKYLTPKQRRQLTKDRYKTYTIAADIMNDVESVENCSQSSIDSKSDKNTDESFDSETHIPSPRKSRLNPKQKRQEDRARYQTQTVCASTLYSSNDQFSENVSTSTKTENLVEMKKSIKQKRIENSERFKTRIIDECVPSSPDPGCNDPQNTSKTYSSNICSYSHSQLAKDAIEAFEFLQQQTFDDTSIDIDCETISLVSEDDSELNTYRLRTITKSFRNYLPVIESPSVVDKCIEKNLKNLNENSKTSLHINGQNSTDIIESSDINSIERDQNSGTESADQNVYSDSEGETQIKHKAIIVKPIISKTLINNSNGSLNSDENLPKPIRGRKKAPYVSPYRRSDSANRKNINKTPVNAKAKGALNGSTRTANNHVGKNSYSIKKSSMVTSKTVNVAYAKHSDKLNSKTCSTKKKVTQVSEESPQLNPVLVRQGTFTKEDSAVLYVTKVSPKPSEKKENFNSKLVKPTSVVKNFTNTSPSKLPLPPTRNICKPVVKPESELTVKNVMSKTKTSSKIKNSISNQSLQSNESTKTVTLHPKSNASKCNSNSSVNSATSSKTSVKDVSSKVASLWKKVEQQKRNNPKPDDRVWVTNSSKDHDATSKLTRSSTFEGPSKITSSIPVPPKQKSSIALKVSQSPSHKSTSKVPVVKSTLRNVAIVNPTSKVVKN